MSSTIFEKACRIWQMEAYTIQRLPEVVHEEAFTHIVQELHDCVARGGRILVSGKGATGISARRLTHLLCAADIPAVFLDPSEGTHATIGVLRPGDLFILISKGGSTREIASLIEPAQQKGVKVIGITQNPASILGMQADMMLRILVVKDMKHQDILGHGGSIALTAILDALVSALVLYETPEN